MLRMISIKLTLKMKKTLNLIAIIGVISLMGRITCQKKSVRNTDISSKNIQQSSVKLDSVSKPKALKSDEIYILNENLSENIGKLKYDPNTEKSEFKYLYDTSGLEARVVLYYVKERVVKVEKRIYGKDNNEISHSMYNFDETNECFSNTQWTRKDRESYTLLSYNNDLIYYDSRSNVINLDSGQKQELVKSINDSLVSLMKYVPKFKYSSGLK